MEDFVKRMIAEKEELKERIDGINNFIESDKYDDLTDDESDLLYEQLECMIKYLKVLSGRIGLYITKEDIK